MKLKDLSNTIPVNFLRIGLDYQTEQTKFVAVINGESFDFSCGLMACIPEKVAMPLQAWQIASRVKPKMVPAMVMLTERYKRSTICNNNARVLELIQRGQIKAAKNLDNPHVLAVFNDIAMLCAPTSYDLLYCLRSDAEGLDSTFEEWCGNCGYDADSITALRTFEACKANTAKLRKALGDKWKAFMESELD